ncbi:MAG: purine-nucleoside phosphorylase [Desulfobacter sp.]|nr:purine-nucleoside phosphorylase [Desulfobacter sp.]WDP83957.1 MAG: purine-nucleoside phosphorylase [Desulfobacter sp.]
MASFRQKVIETACFIKSRIHVRPDMGVIMGTGLSETLSDLEQIHWFDYIDLPHFPKATVDSHKGSLVHGRLGKKEILVFQGRFHLYEGYTPQEVTFPVRLLQELKVPMLILSNAAGGINLNFSSGDIMLIQDHINLTGKNPLTGPQEEAWGIRFPNMTQVYDQRLKDMAKASAAATGISLQQGIYAGLTGPSLETPAETRYLKAIGGDAVGFSTIMEAIAGVHAGMQILGLSLITNINDPDDPAKTTLEEVVKTAARASIQLNRLISHLITRL